MRLIGCVYCSIDVVFVLEYREAEGIIFLSLCVFISNFFYKSNFWKEKEMKIERIERRNWDRSKDVCGGRGDTIEGD